MPDKKYTPGFKEYVQPYIPNQCPDRSCTSASSGINDATCDDGMSEECQLH